MNAGRPASPARLLVHGIRAGIGLVVRTLTRARCSWHPQARAAAAAGATVYFANHRSHADAVLLWAVLPPALRRRTRPVAAADYWLGSALRRFLSLQLFRALVVERLARRGAANPVQAMAAALQAGEALIVFPEGTRNNSGTRSLLPLQAGLYHLARRCPEVQLVPVWLDQLDRLLPKGRRLPSPVRCSVSLGAPLQLQPGEGCAAFLDRASHALLALRPAAGAAHAVPVPCARTPLSGALHGPAARPDTA